MSSVRIKLSSTNIAQLNEICSQIKDIADRMKVKMKGPIPLPRKELRVPVRRAPGGSGTETFETWEMRISKRVIDLAVNEMALRLIMRIPMPKGVNVEMEIRE
jgi:small subunit ribosomal protein S10